MTSPDDLAEIAEREASNAADAAAWRAAPSQPEPDDHARWFREYAGHAIDALCDWASRHTDRAEARGLEPADVPSPDAPDGTLAAVFDAASDLGRALDAGADDAGMDAVQAALHSAISDAKAAAEGARRGGDMERADQADELECSYLRGWARAFDGIEHARRMARDLPGEAIRWQLRAAHGLAFNAPPTVRHIP